MVTTIGSVFPKLFTTSRCRDLVTVAVKAITPTDLRSLPEVMVLFDASDLLHPCCKEMCFQSKVEMMVLPSFTRHQLGKVALH